MTESEQINELSQCLCEYMLDRYMSVEDMTYKRWTGSFWGEVEPEILALYPKVIQKIKEKKSWLNNVKIVEACRQIKV